MSSAIENITSLSAEANALLLALNNEHREETSFLSEDDWKHLIEEAYTATAVNSDGFLITFDQEANYGSPNFLWFQQKYPNFVYVDRIIVSATARGQGIARILYERLFETAQEMGHTRIVCEVNIDPPNPGSDAFHTRLGFYEVGQAQLKDRGKTVRYLNKDI